MKLYFMMMCLASTFGDSWCHKGATGIPVVCCANLTTGVKIFHSYVHICEVSGGSNVIKCSAESTFTLYNLATITLICLLL